MRDALSLLDQAIAHGAAGGRIDEEAIRAMLGLADRARVIDLFEQVMRGDVATALDGLKALHDQGADPLSIISSLADFVHLVTRLKLVPAAAQDPSLTGEERKRGQAFAASLSLPVLTRAWQMLLKGLADIKDAPRPIAAADMVLVRLAYAADLPTPDEALRQIGSAPAASVPQAGPSSVGSEPRPSRHGGRPVGICCAGGSRHAVRRRGSGERRAPPRPQLSRTSSLSRPHIATSQ